jgi:Domain of unknown function (DUF4190)
MSFTPPGSEQPGSPQTPPPAPPVPGWWQASDGNWYPPEAAPGGAPPAGPYGPPPAAPYGYSPYQQTQGTNGFAIASLVLGIIWIYWIGSILAVIFGFVAMNQIKQRNQGGRGMAIAGLVLGFIGIGFLILGSLALALGGSSTVRFSSVGTSIN